MTNASVWALRKLACLIIACLAMRGTTALASEPHMGPFHNRMTFAEMRAAMPQNNWSMRPYHEFGIIFGRAQIAPAGLDWLRRKFDLSFERTGYPTSALIASIQIAAVDASSCETQVGRLADDLDANLGPMPAAWSDSPPKSFGRADSLAEGFQHFSAVETSYGYAFPEAEKAQSVVRTPQRLKLTRFQMLKRGAEKAAPKITGWRSYRMVGRTLVRVLASFDAMVPVDGVSRCLASITFKSSGETMGQGALDPKIETGDLTAPVSRLPLAYRHAQTLLPSYQKVMPKAGAQYYECQADVVSGALKYCHADSDPEPSVTRTPDSYSRFLEKEINIPLTLDEEDFVPRKIRVKPVAIDPTETAVFDWPLAQHEASKVGIEGFNARQVATGIREYAYGLKENATVQFRCTILLDYSVFCGSMSAEPASLEAVFKRYLSSVALNAARTKVKPVLKDGRDAAGQYFMFKVRYII
jgi:hypothetical protein